MNYIDFHCDTLMKAFIHGDDDIFSLPYAMVDLDRLKKANSMAQFFAIFMPPPGSEKVINRKIPEDDEYIRILSNILKNSVEKHEEIIDYAYNENNLNKNIKENKISAFLTLEDGRSINGNLEKIEDYYKLGIRLISLTWNMENSIGYPNSKDPKIMTRGLTPFGKEAVKVMEDSKIIIDVSHLSDGGFLDVANICKGPFIASHSNCRSISPHQRNLSDDMIKVIGQKGGIIGLNFGPEFLNEDVTKRESTIDLMVAHIENMIKFGGEECVAIGTDFDGINGELEISNPLDMTLLFQSLKKKGYSEAFLEKLAYKNAMRVIKECIL